MKLWIDPSFGASGDMFLGALAALGDTAVAIGVLRDELSLLNIDGYELTQETVTRNGIAANRIAVTTEPTTAARHWSEIDKLLANSELSPTVRDGARSCFRRLGLVEAEMHNVDLQEVHFHEVGAIDALVDIVGSWILFDWVRQQFEIDEVVVGPIGLGHGTVRAAHGTLPLPAPATAALLTGLSVRALATDTETVTPTGAVLLAEFASAPGPIPDGTLHTVVRGAGGRDSSSHPNVLTLMLIDNTATNSTTTETTEADNTATRVDSIVLSTNLDDATPEVIAHTVAALLDAGADDAWVIPIVMKKSRPAHELRVLSSLERVSDLRTIMFRETGTLGIREQTVTKHVLPRNFVTVQVRGHSISMKIGLYGAKPEYEDLANAASSTGLPLRSLALEAQAAFDTTQHPD